MEELRTSRQDCLTFCLFGPTIDFLEPQSSYNDKDIWTFFCLSRFPFKVWIAIELQRWSRPRWTFNLEAECIKILLIGLKKSPFSKKFIEKITVCDLTLLDFHQNISKSASFWMKCHSYIFFSYNNCYFDYQKNSVKMQNHEIKNLSNRKSKIHWIVDQIIFHRKKIVKSMNLLCHIENQNFVKSSCNFTSKNCIVIKPKKSM